MRPTVIAVIVHAVAELFRRTLPSKPTWADLVRHAIEHEAPEILSVIVTGQNPMTMEQARELFEATGYGALAVLGVPEPQAAPVVRHAAAQAVSALRAALAAVAVKAAASSLPELETAARGVLEAFNAPPVVDIRPEDVRMELVPPADSSSTTETAPKGLPPLPPSGSSS